MRAIRSIIFILVCIGLLWLGVTLVRNALSSGNTTTPQLRTQKIANYSTTNAKAELFVDGPVIANQEHVAMRITVERMQAKIEMISGYDNQVVRQAVVPNTENSYRAFLKSLESLGFTKPPLAVVDSDKEGKCPLGTRYTYKLTDGNRSVINLWSTSCGAGTYSGQRASTRQLFVRQIPTKIYNDVTKNMRVAV